MQPEVCFMHPEDLSMHFCCRDAAGTVLCPDRRRLCHLSLLPRDVKLLIRKYRKVRKWLKCLKYLEEDRNTEQSLP